MRIISFFAFTLVSISLLSESYNHAEAIGIDSSSHGLIYRGRVVRRYGDLGRDERYHLRLRGLQERAEEIPKDNAKDAKVKGKDDNKNKEDDNNKDAKEPAPKKPKAPTQKGKTKDEETPPSKPDTTPSDDTTDTTVNQDQKIPENNPGAPPPVATGSLSPMGIAGLSSIGGVFVLVAGLFAFSKRRKNKEMTKSILSTSAKAWEQQNSTYEIMEEETKIIGSFIVKETYTPTLSDELDIQPGDKVTILVEFDDGWVQGINETRGGTKGVFPRHCVDMSHMVPNKNNKRSSSMGGGYTEVDLS